MGQAVFIFRLITNNTVLIKLKSVAQQSLGVLNLMSATNLCRFRLRGFFRLRRKKY